jgi:putative redox protein
MAQINVGLQFGREFEGELSAARAGAAIGMGDGQLRPYDMLLGALGACYYSTFVDIAKKMRLEYEGASIDISGVKRQEVPTTLATVDMVFTIRGVSDQKSFRRAADLAAKYCSVHETVSKVAEISLDVRFG